MLHEQKKLKTIDSEMITEQQLVHHFIAIEGPIGVGKTTPAKRLAETFGKQVLLEPSFENPF